MPGSKQNAGSPDRAGTSGGSAISDRFREAADFLEQILGLSVAKGTFGERLKSRWEETRTSMALKHLLIASESQDEYIQSYLRNGDNASFLKTKPDAKWQTQLQYFNAELAEIAGLAKNAGVPLVAVFVPNRAQAAMISKGDWPAGYDPFKLKDELRESVVSDGGRFIDILPHYRGIPSPERSFFPVDGHPDANGQTIIFKFLAKELTSGAVPALKATEFHPTSQWSQENNNGLGIPTICSVRIDHCGAYRTSAVRLFGVQSC